jgi:L-ribulose-5-phosphate 3-epimerase
MISAFNYWGFEHGLSNDHPIGAAAKQAAQAGFQAIELAISEIGVLSVTSSQADCREIRAEVERAGIRLESVGCAITWGCSPSHPDPAVRQKAVQLHEAALQRVAWLGCTSMLFVPGAVAIPWDASYPFVPYEKAYQWSLAATRTLAMVAERFDVELCIENVWNGMFYSPLEFRDFIDSIGSSHVGAYFDTGNCMGQHQYPPHWIELLGQRIKRVHLKDFKRSVGNLDGFCDLMEGDQPWAETMSALRDVGYDRTLTAEMIPFAPGRIEKTGQALKAIMQMLTSSP